MTLEDTIRALVPGITVEHLARTVDEVRAATRRSLKAARQNEGIRRLLASPPARDTFAEGARRKMEEWAAAHQPTPQVGDVWEHRRIGRVALTHRNPGSGASITQWAGVIGPGDEIWIDTRFGWRLVERDGKPWPPAQEPESAREAGVKPATDEDIADDEAMCLCDEPLDWDEECTREAVLALVARVRQEQARAEKAEAEVAELRPVVEAAINHVYGDRVGTWGDLVRVVDAHRDAQEAGQ